MDALLEEESANISYTNRPSLSPERMKFPEKFLAVNALVGT